MSRRIIREVFFCIFINPKLTNNAIPTQKLYFTLYTHWYTSHQSLIRLQCEYPPFLSLSRGADKEFFFPP